MVRPVSHSSSHPSGPSSDILPLQQVVYGTLALVTSQPTGTGAPAHPPQPSGAWGAGHAGPSLSSAASGPSHCPLGEYSIPIQGLPIAGLTTSSQGVYEGPLISVCDPLGVQF